jgi:peptidoglycan/xylan/chitin deacetylase (PgdA/CDA1 family)
VNPSVAGFIRLSGLGNLIARAVPWSGVLALTYHRIGDGCTSLFDRGLWSADAEAFAEQIRFCKSHVDVIAPGDLPAVVSRGSGRYALITFDDGYRDNYEIAFPILKAEGVPATFFIATGFVDTPRLPWWDEIAWMVRTSEKRSFNMRGWLDAPVPLDEPDREGAVRTLLRGFKAAPADAADRYLAAVADATGSGRCGIDARDLWLTWEMVREMRAAGMTIGGHTSAHIVLARASAPAPGDSRVRPSPLRRNWRSDVLLQLSGGRARIVQRRDSRVPA